MSDQKLLLSSSDVTERLGISLQRLYYWELKGVVRPLKMQIGSRKFKQYTEEDLQKLGQLKFLLDNGYTLEDSIRKIKDSSIS